MEYGKSRILNPQFKDKEVILWESLPIIDKQVIKIKFILKTSSYRQGIFLMTDSGFEVLGNTYPSLYLWEDTAPEECFLKCYTKNNCLSFYNIWDTGRGKGSQSSSSGMLLEKNGDKYIYHCNDFGFETKFDKIVFAIEFL